MPSWFGLARVKGLLAVLVLAAVAGFAAYKMHQHDQIAYDKLMAEYNTFKGGVAALGEKAKTDAAKQALHDLKNKERADNENKRTTTANAVAIARLRRELDAARGSYVPPAPAGTEHPELACFDRDALGSAIRGLVAEVRRLVDEGTAAVTDLNTAKIWNQGRLK